MKSLKRTIYHEVFGDHKEHSESERRENEETVLYAMTSYCMGTLATLKNKPRDANVLNDPLEAYHLLKNGYVVKIDTKKGILLANSVRGGNLCRCFEFIGESWHNLSS